jgi:hypothetical protein
LSAAVGFAPRPGETRANQPATPSPNLQTGGALPHAEVRRGIYQQAIRVQNEAQALIARLDEWEGARDSGRVLSA